MGRIDVTLDIMLARRRMKMLDLAEITGITKANLSLIKRNKIKAIRFTTFSKICKALDCQPSDLIRYVEGE